MAAAAKGADPPGKWTRDDIRKALAAVDQITLQASLYGMGVPVPLNAPNQTLLDLAIKVADYQLQDMNYVVAKSSYQQWIPLKRSRKCLQETDAVAQIGRRFWAISMCQ
ncbi:hypothetical protein TWF281_007878 [Arthrobotrys megalospora]